MLTVALLTAGTCAAADGKVAGKPDLNGVWQVLNTANYDIEAHSARSAMATRPGPFGPVPAKPVLALGAVGAVPAGMGVVDGGEVPYQPWALAKKKENQANWLDRDPEIKCYLPGVPRATYMPFPFQIFHSEQAIFFAYEYAGAVRNINLTDPGEAPVDSWMGQSVGSWDGDTLVIVATGFNDRTWFDRSGNFHSDQLKVTERYTPINEHTMAYQATIEDPAVFTRPWTMSMTLYKRVGADARLQQFKCIEFVEELMYGHLRKTPLE
ncbi:MAG: hypothetical protein HC809_02955 [Gammaproteobacteria bacterium]|nr:hypothetical protein [Gammaproteobacteria bacterium]